METIEELFDSLDVSNYRQLFSKIVDGTVSKPFLDNKNTILGFLERIVNIDRFINVYQNEFDFWREFLKDHPNNIEIVKNNKRAKNIELVKLSRTIEATNLVNYLESLLNDT